MDSAAGGADDFSPLANLLRDGLLLISEAGEIRHANVAAQRLLGRPLPQLTGQPLSAFSVDAQAVAGLVRSACRARSFTPGALTLVTGSGQPLPCRCDGALYRQRRAGEPALAVLRIVPRHEAAPEFLALRQRIEQLSREITAKRQAEQALAASSARYRTTLESIGDAVIATDGAGAVRFMNRVAEQLTGWSLEEARGHHLDEVFVILDETTREPVESPVAKVLREDTVVGLANHTLLLRRDGSALPIDDSGAPIRAGDGRLDGVVLVFRDLTERHALERELLATTTRLKEADRRKDEFLSMLAHELRNPLAPLRNGVEIIRRQPVPAPVLRTTEMMARQITHMVRLVDDLLDVSRLTQGKIDLRLAPIAVPDLIRHAEEMVRPLFHQRGVNLEVAEPAPEVKVHGDLARLVQVLGNLLGNAAKFSPPGALVTLEATARGPDVDITVADQGVGIEPGNLPYLFDLFFQGEQGLGREQGGLGVGLTISRSIMRMHGGSIRAGSEGPGRGSAFTISLPLLA